jgi:hypothetical protein
MQAALQNVVASSQSSPGSMMPLPHTGAAPVVGSISSELDVVVCPSVLVVASLVSSVEVEVPVPVELVSEDEVCVESLEPVLEEHSVTPRSAMMSSMNSTAQAGISKAPDRRSERRKQRSGFMVGQGCSMQ